MRHLLGLPALVLAMLLYAPAPASAQTGGVKAPPRGEAPRTAQAPAGAGARPSGSTTTKPAGSVASKPAGPAASKPAGPAAKPAGPDVPRQAGPGIPNVPAQPPFPPLDAVHQKYLDDVLNFWEKSSNKISTYQCKFQRWEYDPVFGPKEAHKTFSTGIIKYATPDKGLFKVEKIHHYKAPESKDEKPKYEVLKDDFGDHWMCDGNSVFRFDYARKKLVESPLPPDMKGQAIVDGPLPFLFGAKANKIKERYWVRVVTPSDAEGEYWLEAFPKSRADAANFKKIEIIIDEADFLPKAIQVFMPGYDEKTNPSRSVFMFSDRQRNGSILDPLKIFTDTLAKPPATPKGWEKIVERYGAEPPAPPKANQAARPGTKPALK